MPIKEVVVEDIIIITHKVGLYNIYINKIPLPCPILKIQPQSWPVEP
jgi:hypothetical protein